MPLPSYARATASSALKTPNISNQHPTSSSSSSASSNEPSKPHLTPKKTPKRPSTITPKYRESIAYRSDLYHIKPKDPSKPCYLADLPSELRTTIYEHVLSSFNAVPQPRFIMKKGKQYYIWPSILHIARAIRIEAAYTYYTTTPFTFEIRNLNFTQIITWLELLPMPHRSLLTRNRHLHIAVTPYLRHSHTYPPPNYLLDAPLAQHWRACAPYGNLYSISHDFAKVRFVLFCRLMSWFHFNDERDLRWRYGFAMHNMAMWRTEDAIMQLDFLKDMVGSMGMGRVMRAWTRGRVRGKGKEEARRFLIDLDTVFRGVRGVGADVREEWDRVIGRLKRIVEEW